MNDITATTKRIRSVRTWLPAQDTQLLDNFERRSKYKEETLILLL